MLDYLPWLIVAAAAASYYAHRWGYERPAMPMTNPTATRADTPWAEA